MQRISLIDTHCDTASRIYSGDASIVNNAYHVSLDNAKKYKNYTQYFAVWADSRLSDEEAYRDFLNISDYLFSDINVNKSRISLVRTYEEMDEAWKEGKAAAFLAVEDARILAGKLERLDELKARGVKYLTLLWGGETCIGASHDVDGSLTEFGIQVVKKCFENGIIPDVSHANERVTDQVCEIAFEYNKPFIATHSDCYEVFSHTRNLRQKHLDALIKLGGTVGLNLCTWHIKKMLLDGVPNADYSNVDELVFDKCTIDDLMRHVEGFLEQGAENALCLGCDLDGTDLPDGFSGVQDVEKIADAMAQRGYSDELIEKVFWRNQLEFIKKNF